MIMLSQFRKIIFKWKKKIVILILLSVAISFFVSLYLFSLNKHEVVVSDDGFKPVTLRINKGAVVSRMKQKDKFGQHQIVIPPMTYIPNLTQKNLLIQVSLGILYSIKRVDGYIMIMQNLDTKVL